jgi:hypothetical protein
MLDDDATQIRSFRDILKVLSIGQNRVVRSSPYPVALSSREALFA